MTDGAGRVLAVDLGKVRVGLALSDPLRITAQPLGTVPRKALKRELSALVDVIRSNDVTVVVVGHPLLMTGAAGESARDAEVFAERLRAESDGTAVILWDERLTTVQAERALIEGNVGRRERRGVIDAAAAAILLQSWLDSR